MNESFRYRNRARRIAALTFAAAIAGISLPTSGRALDSANTAVREQPVTPPEAKPRISAREIESILPLFIKSPEARQLAETVEFHLRNGNVAEARNVIERVVEASTFAVLAADWLSEPKLLDVLQAQGIRGGGGPARADNAAEHGRVQEALAKERERNEAMARDYAALSDKLAGLQSAQDRNANAAAEAAKLQDALAQERERAEAARREASAAAEKLANLQSTQEQTAGTAAEITQLQETLGQERERSTAVSRAYAALSEKLAGLESAQVRSAEAAAEVTRLQDALVQERARSQSAAGEAATLTEKLARLQSAEERAAQAAGEAAKLQAAVAEERQRRESLARDHSALTSKLADLQSAQERNAAAAAEVARLQDALARESERSRTLARDYAALAERLANAQAVQSAPSRRPDLGPTAPEASPNVTSSFTALPAGPTAGSEAAAAPAESPIVKRADTLFKAGDVSGARLLLERAAESGDARAMVLLAETFDPAVLAQRRVLGIRGDPKRAEDLYKRARAIAAGQGAKSSASAK